MNQVTEFDTVRCRRLEVVDADDVVRFVVYCVEDVDKDEVMVELHTPKHRGALHLYADEFGIGAQVWDRSNNAVYGSVSRAGHITVDVNTPGQVMTPMWKFDTRGLFDVGGDD